MEIMTMICGAPVSFRAPFEKMPPLTSIAHHLSHLNRFTGGTSQFYSVAEHCVRVARLCPPECQLEGLLHDASEAFTGDISTPLKQAIGPTIDEIEDGMQRWIAEHFRLTHPWPDAVHVADRRMLHAEMQFLRSQRIDETHGVEPFHVWSPQLAYDMWLETFHNLWLDRSVWNA